MVRIKDRLGPSLSGLTEKKPTNHPQLVLTDPSKSDQLQYTVQEYEPFSYSITAKRAFPGHLSLRPDIPPLLNGQFYFVVTIGHIAGMTGGGYSWRTSLGCAPPEFREVSYFIDIRPHFLPPRLLS